MSLIEGWRQGLSKWFEQRVVGWRKLISALGIDSERITSNKEPNYVLLADHSVRNREIPDLCVAGEPSIIAPDIVRKGAAFD